MSEIADLVAMLVDAARVGLGALFLVALGLLIFDRAPKASVATRTSRPLSRVGSQPAADRPTETTERKAA